MDPIRAEQIAQKLIGQKIGAWLIQKHIGQGKSAVVFRAEQNDQRAALKVFDPELVQRFGKDTQLARIDRELNLIGESHENLVKIFDGGECTRSGYLYVAMEFIDAPNLEDSLTLVPRDKITSILKQIAHAARFLEGKGLAHRDIKPSNIAVLADFSRAVLLDLGVLRPFGDPSLTDIEAREFVGTLRYSSPEFLIREEEDSMEGWRAITFYQLGAVLHDMIMRRPLFDQFSEPYAMLVEAVKSEKPAIFADDIHPNLILLAQNCLVKSSRPRLSLVSWSDFEFVPDTRKSAESARERVQKRSLLTRTESNVAEISDRPSRKQIAQRITDHIESIIRNECAGNEAFPRMEIKKKKEDGICVNVIFATSRDLGLPRQLSIRFDCDLVDESTRSITILASACLLPEGASHCDPSSFGNVFRGPLDSRTLTNRVQDVLWSSIDIAQSKSAELQSNEDIYWLDHSKISED
jgi:serine/threonine protein kinase